MSEGKGPMIGVQEIAKDLRARGVTISTKILYGLVNEKKLPFVYDVTFSATGRAHAVIFRKDYEKWAKEYLEPYGKEVTAG